jgi:gluconokinase
VVIVIMGVSGAGKSTIGQLLADRMRCEYREGDDYHTPENLRKIASGIALTDEDREPWLAAVCEVILEVKKKQGCAVIACSALKKRYRDRLRMPDVRFVFLEVPRAVLLERLKKRKGHFAGPELLESQLQTLEKPHDAIVMDGTKEPETLVREILKEVSA